MLICWVFATSHNTNLRTHRHNSSTTPSSSHRANTPRGLHGSPQSHPTQAPPAEAEPAAPQRDPSLSSSHDQAADWAPQLLFLCLISRSFFKPHLADGGTTPPLNPIEQLEAFNVICDSRAARGAECAPPLTSGRCWGIWSWTQ